MHSRSSSPFGQSSSLSHTNCGGIQFLIWLSFGCINIFGQYGRALVWMKQNIQSNEEMQALTFRYTESYLGGTGNREARRFCPSNSECRRKFLQRRWAYGGGSNVVLTCWKWLSCGNGSKSFELTTDSRSTCNWSRRLYRRHHNLSRHRKTWTSLCKCLFPCIWSRAAGSFRVDRTPAWSRRHLRRSHSCLNNAKNQRIMLRWNLLF